MLDFGNALDGDPRFKYWLTEEFINRSQYEKFVQVNKGDVVLDIGASIGPFLYTIQDRNISKVVAVEPLTVYHDTLYKNAGNLPLTLHKNAIGSEDGKDLELEWSCHTENVKTICFDTIIKENNLTHIDYFKIDCEGGEYFIFTEKYIDWIKDNVKYVVGEFHLNTLEMRESFRKMYKLLKLKGFNFTLESVDGKPITHLLENDFDAQTEHFKQVVLYIDNRQVKKILYIAPHLSTGGLPQYLTKKIELLKDEYEIHLVEWTDVTGGVLVVTKNKIKSLLPDNRFYTLGENKEEIISLINTIKPDIIHLEEIPELAHFPKEIMEQIYTQDRQYKIVETSHDSSFNTDNKQFFPDKFMFVSQWQIDQYKDIDIPKILVEYPIEYQSRPDRTKSLQKLGLNPNKKHVLHIGLFTSRKNQSEFFEYAKMLPDVEFHSVGNQAENFKWYWEPLMKDKPDNLTWWNERTDVDSFYQSMDLFLFTSRGNNNDKETMPLVIREALSYQIPQLLYNLEVYQNYFDSYDSVNYLTFDNLNENKNLILEALGEETIINPENEAFIISTYPNSDSVIQTTKKCIESIKSTGRKVILTSHIPIPDELSKLADYSLNDNNNILTKHSYYSNYFNSLPEADIKVNLKGNDNDIYHGPSCYSNYHNGAALANNLGFNKLYFLNYDYILTESKGIDKISSILNKSNAYLGKYKAAEGDTVYTYFLGINSKFYLDNIPKITNTDDYESLRHKWGSESNGYENMMYHAFKNLSNVYYEEEAKFNDLINNSFIHEDFSRVEYYTILPTNKENMISPFIRISNAKESKTIRISSHIDGNENHIDTIEVNQKIDYYKLIPYVKDSKIKFTITDKRGLVGEKILSTDNLTNNGQLTIK